MNKLMEALKQQKELLESQGYSVAYICIYGSQNYKLDIYTEDYKSDIDMKAIIVPNLDDLVFNSKPVSIAVDTEWGQCDIKDIRTYFQTLLKANPAYIETLFTKYYLVDEKFTEEFKQIFSMKEELVQALKAQFIRSLYGMMCEKEKALCHPYPSTAHKIEKFGYCGKQAHHIGRLNIMMRDYFLWNKTLEESMCPDEKYREVLIEYKLNISPLDTVIENVKLTMTIAKRFKDEILSKIDESKIDYSVKDKFIALSQDIIKNKITQEMRITQ